MKIQPDSPTAKRSALASTVADLRELKGNSRATVQELQAFLRELNGKSPHEMLGIVSANQFFRSLILSTGLVTGGILIFTAIPYFFGDKKSPAPVTAAAPPVTPPPTPQPPPEPQAPPKSNPLSALGVGDELPAPPNKNPLESKGDDFLKDLE